MLDVEEDFYGYEVALDFVARVRGQERFDRIEDLVAQIPDETIRGELRSVAGPVFYERRQPPVRRRARLPGPGARHRVHGQRHHALH